MDIIEALQQEESKLQQQLTAIQAAIGSLDGSAKTVVAPGRNSSPNGTKSRKVMSASVRAKIARSAKARWAKIRTEKAKKAK